MESNIRTCELCGRYFKVPKAKGRPRAYCSAGCRREALIKMNEASKLKNRFKKKHTGMSSIARINEEAVKHGMSYGQYVAYLEMGGRL